jgi:histidinol phosphatase-like enzyme (inositol monophosphatase family)
MSPGMDADLPAFLDTLADAAGAAILPYFRAGYATRNKAGAGGFDPVTEADQAGESAMRALIAERFPGHGILGEEYGAQGLERDDVWVLDPIDGTRAFLAGLPTWGTLIGLNRRGVPRHGLMHQPFTGERFAGDGRTAGFRHGAGPVRALRTRACAALGDAILCTTDPRLFADGPERAGYAQVEAAVRMARYGADCYAYCMLAAGQVDLVVEAGLKPYDIVALIPIVAGAGGVVTSWDGGSAAEGGRVVAAGDPRLHEAALRLLAG